MRPPPKKPLLRTLLWAALALFLLAQPGGGFLILFVALALVLWIPYAAFMMVRRPETRALRLARIGIWVAVAVLMAGIHRWRDVATRRSADAVVAQVERFRAAHGRYPNTIDEIGLTAPQLKDRLGAMSTYHYDRRTGRARLGYHTTWTPFGYCGYAFDAAAWHCRAD